MAYHPFRHLGLKFLSIGLAVLLWLTVAREPIVERTMRIPLQFQNMPQQLVMVGNPLGNVDVRVKGSSGAVSRLQPGDIVAVVDLDAARPGQRLFHLVTEHVRVPFGIDVEHVAPATVGLEFERAITREVPVVPAIDGEPAPGFVVGTISAEPAKVVVVGPETHTRRVTEATTEPVSVLNATTTVQDTVTIGVTDPEVRVREVREARVTVAIAPAPVERTVNGVPVQMRGLGRRLVARAVPPVVTVVVRGTREVVGRLQTRQVVAFIDLAGLGPGRYNLPVRVDPGDAVGVSRVEPDVAEVTIR
jgi:YbbR domain-containing protein